MTTLGGSPPLDIWVRSSGVKRLSDFLVWQVRSWFPLERHYLCCIAHEGNAQIHFIPTYWPKIGFWDLFPIILGYQIKVWCQQARLGA